jgi:hypothetical protein
LPINHLSSTTTRDQDAASLGRDMFVNSTICSSRELSSWRAVKLLKLIREEDCPASKICKADVAGKQKKLDKQKMSFVVMEQYRRSSSESRSRNRQASVRARRRETRCCTVILRDGILKKSRWYSMKPCSWEVETEAANRRVPGPEPERRNRTRQAR